MNKLNNGLNLYQKGKAHFTLQLAIFQPTSSFIMKTTSIIFLLFLSCCQWMTAQCPLGDVTFSTQSQIDSFQIIYPDCNELEGSLTISGPGISDLSGLSGIQKVETGLIIEGTNDLVSRNSSSDLSNKTKTKMEWPRE